MSDAIKRITGTILIILSVLICFIAGIIEVPDKVNKYLSGCRQQWTLHPITPETGGPVQINFADQEELKILPGIGDVLSSTIIEEREKNGVFFFAEDLEAVKGIGLRTIERFRKMIDLSTEESE